MGVVGLAENKANSAPIELELELELSLAILSKCPNTAEVFAKVNIRLETSIL